MGYDPTAYKAALDAEMVQLEKAVNCISEYDPEAKRLSQHWTPEERQSISNKIMGLGIQRGYKLMDAPEHAIELWDIATNSGMLDAEIAQARARADGGFSPQDVAVIMASSVQDDQQLSANPSAARDKRLSEVTRALHGIQDAPKRNPIADQLAAGFASKPSEPVGAEFERRYEARAASAGTESAEPVSPYAKYEGKTAEEIAKMLDPTFDPRYR